MESKYEELQRENKRLREQLAATNSRVDEHKELQAYVEEERELQQQRRQRENAPIWKRAKYWVFGYPGDGQ